VTGKWRVWAQTEWKRVFSKATENYFLPYAVVTNVGSAAVFRISEIDTEVLPLKKAFKFSHRLGHVQTPRMVASDAN
jgi:hypothetical protein